MNMMQFNHIQDPIARAEAMRSQAVAAMILDGVETLRGSFKAASARLTAYMSYRRTYNALAAMTDRELDDIGIGRSDIEAVARGFDPRAERNAVPSDALTQHAALAEAFEQEAEVAAPVPGSNDNRTAAAA